MRISNSRNNLYFIILLFFIFFLSGCSEKSVKNENTVVTDTNVYLNHSDSARYVGKAVCAGCHKDIYESFLQTGMGSSIDKATHSKSSAEFINSKIYDSYSDFHYHAFWKNDSMFIREFRLKGKDTIFKRTEKIDFIIGSGHHTNSHLQFVNGYVNQAPMTYYTQQRKWDLPPGFEEGHNSRFSRPIGLECMSCHNAYPEFVLGSENKFSQVPSGIDCERCHGPGSIHVNQKRNGLLVDTAKQIDYSIVNPAKLPIERQFDICMRCHLQGNAILSEGKSWYDFKPGMKLSEYVNVFLPRYKNADEEFIMASHADRLRQSKCFLYSLDKVEKNKKSLKPYKEALTCVSCHNPHVSVRGSKNDMFNKVCNSCHNTEKKKICSLSKSELEKNKSNCISCHMPSSGSIDIPHVTIHDHYIRKPITKNEIKSIKEFVGLFAVNNKIPDSLTRAQAYVNQFEKFERKAIYLDSADRFMPKNYLNNERGLSTKIQILFNRERFKEIIDISNKVGISKLIENYFSKKTITNNNAWDNYRVGEAYMRQNNIKVAIKFYSKACELAPHHSDFKMKYGVALQYSRRTGEARKVFTAALIENPRLSSAWVNLGYLDASEGNFIQAENNYLSALKYDPDNIQALINLGSMYIYQNKYEKGAGLILDALNLDKDKPQAIELFYFALDKIIQQKNSTVTNKLIIRYKKLFPSDNRVSRLAIKRNS
ncbi:MAG: pilus assembly protein TadD [Bacteroidota bacterium]